MEQGRPGFRSRPEGVEVVRSIGFLPLIMEGGLIFSKPSINDLGLEHSLIRKEASPSPDLNRDHAPCAFVS